MPAGFIRPTDRALAELTATQIAAGAAAPMFTLMAFSTVNTIVAGTAVPVDFNLASHNPESVTLGTSIQMASGTYLVETDVALRATGSNSRSSCDVWIENDGSEESGTRGQLYVRQTNFGATATVSAVVTDPGALTVVAVRTNGTSTIEVKSNGARLRVWKL